MKKVSTGFSLPPDLIDWLKAESEKNGLSLSAFVTMVLTKARRESD